MMAKKFVICLSGIIIIAFSFVMPKLFFQIEDISREKEMFARPKKETKKIDGQAEKIYLVGFIHEIYNLKNNLIYYNDKKKVSVGVPVTERTNNTVLTEEIKTEISKLITNNILKEIDMSNVEEYYETRNIFTQEYVVTTSEIINTDFVIGVGIEEKTGKIISINFPQEFLRDDIAKRKQLEDFAKYLDLDIIDDWKYENQILKSEKAQLSIVLEEKNGICILTIAPIEVYAEYEAIQREDEIVERNK